MFPTPTERSPSDRRVLADRRARPMPLWAVVRHAGRRGGFRRRDEGHNEYVDRASARTALFATFVVLASALDAFLTLVHINRGGSEVNPVMDVVLSHGVFFFLSVKLIVTTLGVWLLAVHQLFPVGRLSLRFVAWTYVFLLFYHGFLLAR